MSRKVHLSEKFLLDAAAEFRTERGPNGEPSLDDFFSIDLETIVFVFSDMWDALETWQQHGTYRYRYISGRIAYVYYVVGQENLDGSIELAQLEVDRNWPDVG